MAFLRPDTWPDALVAKAEQPDALPIAGGTDLMVELNDDRRRPSHLLDLSQVADLRRWWLAEPGGPTGERIAAAGHDGYRAGGEPTVRLGAAVPYREVVERLAAELPALALAARTVGSPQIRNRGTVGGNLGTASPAGDAHPALLASGALVEAESVRGARLIPVEDFYTGPKRNTLATDELIRAVHVRRRAGPQSFAKVGPRNAMVIAVCSFAVALDGRRRLVRTGLGAVAATPLRSREAEEYLAAALTDGGHWDTGDAPPPAVVERFAELTAAACQPIDDVRGRAGYRRHAVAVLARRGLGWVWDAYRDELRSPTCG